ncbi:GNAT family N-acetyltransferase [Tellurirhabdus rosea]|uniref:GNAT family N-acetyltransferase n=1 Tax=Tellurirhabdus rosea TaxID=2674997 RepID=UPI0022556556|nr:GNAT family N-acetyltransferase [Tellurirhabdus rosea]
MITVQQVTHPEELKTVFAIRESVFVQEQNVPAEEEYDEFETSSRHFLAFSDGTPCGTARWRTTSNGVKLERFAVLKAFRGQGVGRELVHSVLEDVFSQQPEPLGKIYLHAQVTAMPLYAGFGFEPVGDSFDECGIQHYKMVLPTHRYSKN